MSRAMERLFLVVLAVIAIFNVVNVSGFTCMDTLGGIYAHAAVTEPACAPLLVDQNGRVCEIMLGEEIPERKTQIASGESVLETLVFRTPDEKIMSLRLVLPSGVFGTQEVLGFEIPIRGE